MIPPKRNTNTGTFAARKIINASFEASPGCVRLYRKLKRRNVFPSVSGALKECRGSMCD